MFDCFGSKSTEATLRSTLKLTRSNPATALKAAVKRGKSSAVRF